jgi:hypothetical protein
MRPTQDRHRSASSAAVAALVVMFTVTGCTSRTDGRGAEAADATKSADQAMAEFAACMREHGVDLPDGGVVTNGSGEDPLNDDPDFADAQEACEHLLEGVTVGGDNSGELDAEMQDALLAYAECMRAEGIDMPDPTEGGLVAEVGELPYDPFSPEFEAADEQCQDLLTDAGVEVEGEQP